MLGGGVLALICVSLTSISDVITKSGQAAALKAGASWTPDALTLFWKDHPLLRILCEQPAIWTVPAAILLMIIISKATRSKVPADARMKMLVLHAPEGLGLKQEYIQEHQGAGH
jgi:hypothetical protein